MRTTILATILFLLPFSGCIEDDARRPLGEVVYEYCFAVFHWQTEPAYVVNVSWDAFQANAPIMAHQFEEQVESGELGQLGGRCEEVLPEMQWLASLYEADANATATEVAPGASKLFFDVEYNATKHRMSIHDRAKYHSTIPS